MKTTELEDYMLFITERAEKVFPLAELETIAIVIYPFTVIGVKIFQAWFAVFGPNGKTINKYEHELSRSFIETTSLVKALESLDCYLNFMADKNAQPKRLLEEGEAIYELNGFAD